ncbi:MAG: GNAT family N-acetyltransferase, partial [Planctomycetes bacterium]|nr:GNAT family N-acetyltransferase [Planctomycetota bacterium]
MTPLAQSLSLRPFRLDDAGAIEPWLSSPGLSLPRGAARRDWPVRLLADGRILLQVAEAKGFAAMNGGQLGLVRLDCGPDRVAEITIIVAPECRRQGLGRVILQQAIVQARGLGLVQLVASVDVGNAVALDFFQDMGFVSRAVVSNRLQLVRDVHAGGMKPLEIVV